MHLSTYIKKFPYPPRPGYLVLFSSFKGSLLIVPEKVYAQAVEGSLQEKDAATLASAGMLVNDRSEEMTAMRRYMAELDRSLTEGLAIVILNLVCNLACPYCYEGTLKGDGKRMSAATAAHVVRFVVRRHLEQGKDSHVDFTGGEPLLSLDLLKEMVIRLRDESAVRGRKFTFSMVSNGTLLNRDVVLELRDLGLTGVKVTLDGSPEQHNRSRPYRNGSGSFDDIMRNIRECAGLIGLNLGGNYTEENYREFPRLLDLLQQEGISPTAFNAVAFNPISKTLNLPPELADAGYSEDAPWIPEAVLFLRKELLRRGYRVPPVGPVSCLVESAYSHVVNWDGGLYKCPVLVGNEVYRIGHVGAPDENLEAYAPEFWQNDTCLSCGALPLCFGGCRFEDIVESGRVTAPRCKREVRDDMLEQLLLQDIELVYGIS